MPNGMLRAMVATMRPPNRNATVGVCDEAGIFPFALRSGLW